MRHYLLVIALLNSVIAFGALVPECDSLYLSNGKVYAVKNLSTTDEEVRFSFCDDPTNEVRTAPWMQVHHIKKADGSVIDSPKFKAELSTDEAALEHDVNQMHLMAVVAIPAVLLFGVGWIFSAIALVRAGRLLRKIAGHPHEQYLRKRLLGTRRLAKFNLFFWLAAGVILFTYAIVKFIQYGNEIH